MIKHLTVTELTGYIKQLVDNDMLLTNVWVTGEISNFKAHSSGHMYFSLKDERSVIKCVMFRSKNFGLKFRPEDGMRVIIRGYVSVYPAGGTYQLYVDEMQPDGTGALYLAFEQLKKRMEALGYFDESRKKPIPKLPRTVGVITSPTGAVIRDICHVLGRRYPNSRIILYPSAVQGAEAPAQLIRGINYFNATRTADVIILARGGGSLEDLWAFNDENLAMAILNSSVPVISAVGHETDFSISDFVADLRAPTPSAAAELVMPLKESEKDNLKSFEKWLVSNLTMRVKRERERALRLANARSLVKPMEGIDNKRQALDRLEHDLLNINRGKIDVLKAALSSLAGRLNALSPLTVLSRGYAVVQNESGNLVTAPDDLKPGDKIFVTVSKGRFQAAYEKQLDS
jgi:exodeoxyribonuclease VII large subunit